MPQIGWSELLIIVVIAILIIGPNINQITDIDDVKPSTIKEKNNTEKNENKK